MAWLFAKGSAIARIRDLVVSIVPRGALLLSALTLASYVMGLVRDRAFARTFGASSELDVYNAALVLPELALDVLVVAGLSSAFVPVFARLKQADAQGTQDFARTVLTVSVLVMIVAVGILFVLADQAVSFVAPGFASSERALYTELFRVMCVTAVIFAASFALGEMLVVRQRFLAYGLAPVLYNTGIVLGTIFLSPALGILGAAIGTVLGALLYLGIRVIDIARTDFRYRPAFTLRSSGFREYVRLALPKAISAPIEPLTFLYFTSVASTLAAGSISAVSFARNFQSVPVSLIGIAFSVAAFPIMAAAVAAGDRVRFTRLVATNLATITILTSIAAVGLVLIGGLAVETFLGGGAFDADDVAMTTMLLGVFALSVPLEALTQLLSRAIYSTHDTILPVSASIAGLIVTVAAVNVLADAQGIVALPLGFAAGQATKVVLLLVALALRVRSVGQPRTT
ncbi:MAG TPA: lipid II flippase MurJ [Candidatus Limnocylindrales bacterium]|nr:lipid II flippase MurJ [Candidatus Limnocylindrales bacterium]